MRGKPIAHLLVAALLWSVQSHAQGITDPAVPSVPQRLAATTHQQSGRALLGDATTPRNRLLPHSGSE